MRRFKQGYFSKYKGQEYKTIAVSGGRWRLISKQANQGFTPCGVSTYCMEITPDQVESSYLVQVWVSYKDYHFTINGFNEKENTVELGVSVSISFDVVERLFGYRPKSTYEEYMPTIKVDDLDEIWEERKPIEGFPFNEPEKVYFKRKGE
ncbi:MAG: hypothetical protein HC831_29895 [Chloroflexia bacterium]|nr:hypothetical protein [Chloroflexia bacterium]